MSMVTGQSKLLTGKIGEHLVTARLAMMGIIATPFSGNVPEIDILGYANRIAAPFQVKIIDLTHGDAWQFDVRKFIYAETSDTAQRILGPRKDFNRSLLCIFVALKGPLEAAEFYIFKYGWLQDYFSEHYKARKPPQKVSSFSLRYLEKRLETTHRQMGRFNTFQNLLGFHCEPFTNAKTKKHCRIPEKMIDLKNECKVASQSNPAG
jgi:hypothetical protein